MKMIFGNKRVMLSLSGIVLALVLMIGGTFAWLTSGPGGPTNGDFGILDTAVTTVDPTSPFNSITPIILQPGYSFKADAEIVNQGNLKAVFVIPAATVTIRSDSKGKPLAPADYHAANPALYTVGYDIVGPLDDAYLSTNDANASYAPEKVNIAYFKLPAAKNSTGKDINLLYFDAAGDYYTYDDEGEPIVDADGKYVLQNYERVALAVKPVLDFKTHAIDMGNEWNNALLEGFVPKATQGEYDQAVIDVFGLKDANGVAFTEETFVEALVWGDSNNIRLRSLVNRDTPSIKAWFGKYRG